MITVPLNPNPSKQRQPAAEELQDQVITSPCYFGTYGPNGLYVWHSDGQKVVRVGASNPDHLSMVTIDANTTLRAALESLPMFNGKQFVIHNLLVPLGAYYPRIDRPGRAAGIEDHAIAKIRVSSLNELRSLVAMLTDIFQVVHPIAANMACFGNAIRNLLILACTECEAQWRGVMEANGYQRIDPKSGKVLRITTCDYVKIRPVLRLAEYELRLKHFPWLEGLAPFDKWSPGGATQTIPWYDNYNHVKHDRENEFPKASLLSAIESVAAVAIMIVAQFGIGALSDFDDLQRYFHFEKVPMWHPSEYYTSAFPGHDADAGQIKYSF